MFITIMHIRYIICIFHIIVHFFCQVRRHIVHTLVGGGGQHGGYDALDYRKIHQGNAGKLGNYPILSVLPDKFARFLFEYHSHRFESLDLPLLPADRSDFDVHGALLDDKVQNKMSYSAVYYLLSNATLVLSIITIMTVILYYPITTNFTSDICILFVHSPLFSWPSGQNTWHWSR